MSYNAKVYFKQGADEMVVASGGKITVEAGGAIQAGEDSIIPVEIQQAIADLALPENPSSAEVLEESLLAIVGKVNNILTALRGAKVIDSD